MFGRRGAAIELAAVHFPCQPRHTLNGVLLLMGTSADPAEVKEGEIAMCKSAVLTLATMLAVATVATSADAKPLKKTQTKQQYLQIKLNEATISSRTAPASTPSTAKPSATTRSQR
jgi:hypothetical protein